MIPYLLISRSAEYEARMRAMLGARLSVLTGEFLIFGADAVTTADQQGPKIALLGPLLNYAETKVLVEALTAENPDVALVVVREQSSDLEDWVDELELHAVIDPAASSSATAEAFEHIERWLVESGHALASDFDEPWAADPVEADAPLLAATDAPDVAVASSGEAGQAFDELDAEVAQLFAEQDQEEPDRDTGDSAENGEIPPDSPFAWEFPPPIERGAPSEVIAIVAPKGGQGKTTMAINLASGLAEIAPNSVVLVDADLQFGDITVALGLAPERTIIDAVTDAGASDELVLKTMLTHHIDGFFVVASAPSPELGDAVQAAGLATLLNNLRSLFRFVIVDTTPGLGEHTLVTLEHSTDAVFVSNMGVPSLRALRTEFGLLAQIGLLPTNRHVVVNFTDRMSGITIVDAAHIIGAPVDIEVPRSSAVLLASNRGVPLLRDDPRDAASRAIRGLVRRIAPAVAVSPAHLKAPQRRRSREPQ